MKYKIITAFIFYAAGLLRIIDWFLYWNRHAELAVTNHREFTIQYKERFPGFIRILFNTNPEPAAVISVFLFAAAGIIFWQSGYLFLKILAVTAWIFSCWNLFSIM